MKIVFIGGRDIHLIGGIESYMYNLASTLVRFGHHPIVFCESNRNMIRFENGIKVVYQIPSTRIWTKTAGCAS